MMTMSSCAQPRARTSSAVTGRNGCSQRPRRVLVSPGMETSNVALAWRLARAAQRVARVAGAPFAEAPKIVDARAVPVAPLDVDGVVAHKVDGARAHRRWHRLRVEQGLAGHLLDALRAATGEAQLARRVDA